MIILFSSILALPIIWRLWSVALTTDVKNLQRDRLFLVCFGLLVLCMFYGGRIDSEVNHSYVGYLSFFVLPLLYILVLPLLAPLLQKIAGRSLLRTILVIFALLFPLDIGVALDAGRSILEHQLSVLGFYIGLSVTLAVAYRRLPLRPKQVFLAGGLLGLLVEQNFLGPVLLLTNPLGFLVYAPTIFLTYGLYLLAPWLLLESSWQQYQRRSYRLQVVMLFLVTATVPLLVWHLCNLLLATISISAPVLAI